MCVCKRGSRTVQGSVMYTVGGEQFYGSEACVQSPESNVCASKVCNNDVILPFLKILDGKICCAYYQTG